MVTNTYGRWAPRLATLLLWALAGSAAHTSELQPRPYLVCPPPLATTPEPVVTDTQALARLLGASPVLAAAEAAPSAASRFVLMGVLAGTASGGGAALIAVDGKPAKPYRVGANVEPGLVLQSLGKGAARLGASMDGATTLALEMPRKRP